MSRDTNTETYGYIVGLEGIATPSGALLKEWIEKALITYGIEETKVHVEELGPLPLDEEETE